MDMTLLVRVLLVFAIFTTVSSESCIDLLSPESCICAQWKSEDRCKEGSQSCKTVRLLCRKTCGVCTAEDSSQKRTTHSIAYKGCYNDGFVNDVGKIKLMKRELLSVRSCLNACQMENKRYAALQNALYCMCGNDFGKYGPSEDEKRCSKRCAGPEPCGGPWKNAIYEIVSQDYGPSGQTLEDVKRMLLQVPVLSSKKSPDVNKKRENPREIPRPADTSERKARLMRMYQ